MNKKEELLDLFKIHPKNKDLYFNASLNYNIGLTFDELLYVNRFMGSTKLIIDIYDLPSNI